MGENASSIEMQVAHDGAPAKNKSNERYSSTLAYTADTASRDLTWLFAPRSDLRRASFCRFVFACAAGTATCYPVKLAVTHHVDHA